MRPIIHQNVGLFLNISKLGNELHIVESKKTIPCFEDEILWRFSSEVLIYLLILLNPKT